MQRRPGVLSNQSGGTAVSVLLVLGATALFLLVVLHTAAAIKHSRVTRAWEPTIGTLESFLERYPTTEANAAALEIERIAADLGVDIVPRHIDDRPRRAKAADATVRFNQVKKQVFGKTWLKRNLEQPVTGEIEAPPEALLSFLADYDEELLRLRSALCSGPAPAWGSEISKLWDAPIQNLLGHIDLVKLMSSAALARAWAGDEATALEYAEAIRSLKDDLRESPILINQMILIAETRMLAGVFRHLDEVPDAWLDRLETDYREGFIDAMKYEGWVWLHVDSAELTGDAIWQKAARPVLEPLATYGIADVSGDWRRRIVNLEQVESICDYDLSARQADLAIPIPRWNYFGGAVVPNLANAVYRLSRLEMDLELTRLTIEAKRALREGAEVLPSVPSSACSSDSWATSIEDGAFRIAFSREVDWEGHGGPVLSTRALIRVEDAPTQ